MGLEMKIMENFLQYLGMLVILLALGAVFGWLFADLVELFRRYRESHRR